MNGKNKLLIPALVFVITLALGGIAIAVALKLRSPETTTAPLPTEAEEPVASEPEPTIPVGTPATSACYLTFTASGEEPPEENQPPVCERLSASPTSGSYPLTVGFEVTASDPDSNIATYTFDFGDGSQEIVGTATTTHIYQEQGTYTAVVTVKDTEGLSASSSNCRAVITAGTYEEARHFECTSDERCVEVIGSGTNQCLRDSDCYQAPEEPTPTPQPPAPPPPVPDTGEKSFLWLPLSLGLSLILLGTLLFLNDPRWKKFEEQIVRR